MTQAFHIALTTQGGVADLGRVVNVLALLELTPETMTVAARGHGLAVSIGLTGDERIRDLCVARLAALVAARGEISVTPRPMGLEGNY